MHGKTFFDGRRGGEKEMVKSLYSYMRFETAVIPNLECSNFGRLRKFFYKTHNSLEMFFDTCLRNAVIYDNLLSYPLCCRF